VYRCKCLVVSVDL